MTDSREARLLDTVETLREQYVSLLQRLVQTPSPIGQEGPAQEILAGEMGRIGLQVESVEIDPKRLARHPGFVDDGRAVAGRPNIVGVRKGAGGGRSLILNAHMDTAPVEDAGRWTHAPTSGHIEGGRLYGRGSWDDKAGCAQLVWIADALHQAGIRLNGDLILQSVVEDEITGNGTLACVDRGYLADGAIVLDGTWPERIIHAHMGQIMFRVVLHGVSAPACVARRGANPLVPALKLVEAFEKLEQRKNDAVKDGWGKAERPVFINVGRIESGRWPGAVPETCVLEAQYGFCPPDTVQTARAEIGACVDDVLRGDPRFEDRPARVEFFGFSTDPFVGDGANPVIGGLQSTARRLWNQDIQLNAVTGCCDLRHFRSAGAAETIPSCLYGPGGGKNAHTADEYVILDDVVQVAKTVARFAMEWSGAGGRHS